MSAPRRLVVGWSGASGAIYGQRFLQQAVRFVELSARPAVFADQYEPRIFLRKASGLIRTAGLLDVFIYDVGVVSVGLGVASTMLYGPAFYPGGNLVWANLFSAAKDLDMCHTPRWYASQAPSCSGCLW